MSKKEYEEKIKKKLIKKPKNPIKMPSNLEAVYVNGGFAGRKVREPTIPEIAQTPDEYIKLIMDEKMYPNMRATALNSFVISFSSEISKLETIPMDNIKKLINNLSFDEREFLEQNLSEHDTKFIKKIIKFIQSKK
jgi:triacylglycerol esterase/lipase EstA (alpha/beta hydrolase family)